MRPVLVSSVVWSCGVLSCASVPPYAASNSTKLTEAAAFAGAAAVAQIVESAVEAHARNSVPVTGSAGLRAVPQCDNDGQYPCVTLEGSPPSGGVRSPPTDREMTPDELRDYVLAYVNGVRKLNELGPVVRDPRLDAFARAGSDALSLDHLAHRHLNDHAGELESLPAELQDSPEGTPVDGLLQDGIGGILVHWMDEARDGPHRATLMRPEWRKIGIGVASREGRVYVTLDFSR